MRTRAASVGLVVAEIVGCLLMYVPIPAAWMWIGARVYDATGSLMADLLVAFCGFTLTMGFAMSALQRLDAAWVEVRRRAGHDQREGALTRVVVVSATFGMITFWVWFHILSDAFIIPFMPLN